MARRRPTAEPDLLDEEDELLEATATRRRGRGLRFRFLMFLLVAAGCIAAGPTIISKTPLRNALLGKAVPGGVVQLAARDGALSWTGPQELSGVTVLDAKHQPVLTIESASIDRSLISLIFDRGNLGKLTVLRPVLHLDTGPQSSNIEDLLVRFRQAAEDFPDGGAGSASARLKEFEVIDGIVLGRDMTTGAHWRMEQLGVAIHFGQDGMVADATGAGVLATTTPQLPAGGALVNPALDGLGLAAAPGQFRFQYAPQEGGNRQLKLMADQAPLAPLEPLLARYMPDSRLMGRASADLLVGWAAPALEAAVQPGDVVGTAGQASETPVTRLFASGQVNVSDFRFTSSALNGDIIEASKGSASIDAALDGQRITARRFVTDLGWLKADAAGEFDLEQLRQVDVRRLPRTDAALTAQVDLSWCARMMPRTLRLRPGVRIDSGELEISARTSQDQASGGSRRWTVAIALEDLVGHDGTRVIKWTQPLEAGFDAVDTPDGPHLQRALVRSDFASAKAEAVDEGLQGELEFDLNKLAAQLGQFADLSSWKLAGNGKGKFTLRDTGDDRFAAVTELSLKQMDVRNEGRVVWADPELRVELNVNGRRKGVEPLYLERATALMRSPVDSFEVELVEPVAMQDLDRQFAFRIKGDGPLDSWAGRMRPWTSKVPDELAGAASITAMVRAGGGVLEVKDSQVSVRDLTTRIGDVAINEPQLEAKGGFRYSSVDSALDSGDFEVATSTVAAKVRGLTTKLAENGPPVVRGDIAFRGDLERLSNWLRLTSSGAGMWPRGHATGRMQLASDSERATATITMTAEPLTLVRAAPAGLASPPAAGGGGAAASSGEIAWHEPRLEMAARAVYTAAVDRLDVSNMKLTGKTLQLTGGVAIDEFRTRGLVRSDLEITYDSAEFARLLASYLGPGVRFEGMNAMRMTATGRLHDTTITPVATHIRGPADLDGRAHWSRDWLITTEVGWTQGNIYGLPVGGSRLTANVRDGQLHFTPLDLALGQGRITAQPRVRLDPEPQLVHLQPGPLVSNVAISPEVSEAMLKYAAPVLASATRTSGTFSMFLDEFQAPLGEPAKMAASGRLTIHQLSIMPGPMLQQVMGLISQIEALSRREAGGLLGAIAGQSPPSSVKGITMTDRTVDVRVIDGRVYHRNLEFLIDDVPVRSYGSVGFDQTLALVIEVPVQAKWVGREPALQGLIGQVIQIPVTGTFTHWKIDERAVGNFVAQAAQSAAGGLIGEELNKAFDKLLRPR